MRNLSMKKNSIVKHSIALGAMLALILGATSLPTLARPHKPNTSTDVPVKLVVTVKARRGTEVPAVAEADVQVYQRDKPNTITSWVPLQGDRAGLQLFILIDDSARDSIALQFSSIAKFIDEQPPSTSIGIGYMHNGMVTVSQELTSDRALAQKGLRLPFGAAAGSPSPYLALSDLMKKWPQTADRREILMFTSGIDSLGGGFSNDPYNNPYLNEAMNRAQRGGFIIYSIYTPTAGSGGRGSFRTTLSQSGLDLLAQKTGGETYYLGFGAPVDITSYLADVSFSLKHQYELTFLAKGTNKPSLEPVKVKTEMSNMGLRTAENGYVGSGL
jgi:VWFA-related protein